MLKFLKKLLGLPTEEEKKAAKDAALVPYKMEPPTFNNKSGDVVDQPVIKKPRKPRVKKVVETKKTAEAKPTPAAKKTTKSRSKKV
jgi:hypothetical protein